MQEIGEKLKEAREEMGLSIEEVSEDLKVSKEQIEAIEVGNIKAFKDIFSVKFFVRDYSKYLGLNYDEMIDDFNEYVFDFTSKLSLSDIKKAKEESKPVIKGQKISSPYTNVKRRFLFPPIVIWIVVILLIGIIGYFIYDGMDSKPTPSNPSQIIE